MEKNKKIKKKSPKGIGGWLLIPTIRVMIELVIALLCVVLMGIYLFTAPDIFMLIMFLVSIGATCLLFYVLKLEFKKKKEFIRWSIRLLWIEFIFLILVSFVDGDFYSLFGGLIGLLIWKNYFEKSKRVKNTFIN